jgi:hypothetical protein
MVAGVLAFAPARDAPAEEKTWTGAQNGTWDTLTANWLLGGGAATFAAGDDATFGDSTTTAVTLSGTQQAGVVVFSGDADYSLETDVLADLEIRGGTLKLGSGTSTGLGNLLLSNATLQLNGGAGSWPAITMNGSWLEFMCDDPAKPYVIAGATGSNNGFFLGRTRPIDVRVPDITMNSDPDVTFNVPLHDAHGTGALRFYGGLCARRDRQRNGYPWRRSI